MVLSLGRIRPATNSSFIVNIIDTYRLKAKNLLKGGMNSLRAGQRRAQKKRFHTKQPNVKKVSTLPAVPWKGGLMFAFSIKQGSPNFAILEHPCDALTVCCCKSQAETVDRE